MRAGVTGCATFSPEWTTPERRAIERHMPILKTDLPCAAATVEQNRERRRNDLEVCLCCGASVVVPGMPDSWTVVTVENGGVYGFACELCGGLAVQA